MSTYQHIKCVNVCLIACTCSCWQGREEHPCEQDCYPWDECSCPGFKNNANDTGHDLVLVEYWMQQMDIKKIWVWNQKQQQHSNYFGSWVQDNIDHWSIIARSLHSHCTPTSLCNAHRWPGNDRFCNHCSIHVSLHDNRALTGHCSIIAVRMTFHSHCTVQW